MNIQVGKLYRTKMTDSWRSHNSSENHTIPGQELVLCVGNSVGHWCETCNVEHKVNLLLWKDKIVILGMTQDEDRWLEEVVC